MQLCLIKCRERIILILFCTFLALLFTITACGSSGEETIQTAIQPTESAQESIAQEGTSLEVNFQTLYIGAASEAQLATCGGTEMKIQVGDTIFTATLAENSSVDALKELMADGPLTLNMSDYAGMEKGADLGVTLPQNNEQMNAQAGDIILYQGRTFVIYYDTNSWSLTPIGKIDNVDAESLRAALGDGDVTVTLSLE